MNHKTKTALRFGVSALIVLLGSACTMEGKPVDNGKTTYCTDTRDGEKFSFKSSSVRNARIGMLGADTCADITVSTGETRTLCKSQEAYIKCVSK